MLNIFRPRQPDTFHFCPTFFEISIIAHNHHNHHVITIPGPLDNSDQVPYGARKCHRGPEIHTLDICSGYQITFTIIIITNIISINFIIIIVSYMGQWPCTLHEQSYIFSFCPEYGAINPYYGIR